LVSLSATNPHPPAPGPDQPSLTARRALAALALALGVVSGLAGCGGDDYCGAVQDHQAELTDVTASGSPGALLAALPIFRDLADRAPEDIRADWKVFLHPLEELDAALSDAGVDPASYDRTHPPDGLTDAQSRTIEEASAALADPAVVRAFDSVQQQAKDVCHTPLSL
jgi:hypothetical protein